MRLGLKLGLSYGITAFVMLILLSISVYVASFSQYRQAVIERQRLVTERTLKTVDVFFYERVRDIEAMADAFIIERIADFPAEASYQLNEWTVLTGPWDELVYLNADGSILASDETARIGTSIFGSDEEGEQEIFERALLGETVVSDAVRSNKFNRPTVIIASPVRSEIIGSPVIGVLIGEVSWPAVEEILFEIPIEDIHLLNNQGELLADKSENHGYFIPYKEHTLSGEGSIFSHASESGYQTYFGNGWSVNAAASASELLAPATRNALYLTGVASILLVVSILLVFGVLRVVVVRPITAFTKHVIEFTTGKLKGRLPGTSNDEIGVLGAAFNGMADELNSLYSGLERTISERTSELQEEKKKLQTTLESIGDGAFVVDRDERVTFFNEMATTISGFSSRDILGQPYREVLKFIFEETRDENDRFVKEALQEGKVAKMANHTLLITKSGKEIPVADSAAPIKDKNDKVVGCIVIFRDVTKEYEIDRMKTEFISLASHQLRTPLTAIRWSLEAVRWKDMTAQKKKDMLSIAEQSAKKMADIVTALLNIARIESSRLSIHPALVDPKALFDEVVQTLASEIEKKHLKVTVEAGPDLHSLTTDKVLLAEVLSNLVSNSVKYTREGGTIDIHVEKVNDDVKFTVKDNGLGIPKAQQDRIFQKFFRADNVARTVTEGSGLGLYLVQQLVETLQGKIGFTSEENVGTTFWVTVPTEGLQSRKGEVSLATK